MKAKISVIKLNYRKQARKLLLSSLPMPKADRRGVIPKSEFRSLAGHVKNKFLNRSNDWR